MPQYETALGLHGDLADAMAVLAHEVWQAEWVGGMEHHLWALYLESLAGPEPSADSAGARVRVFGALAVTLGGLWVWPMDEPGPRWCGLEEFERRHEVWVTRRDRVQG